EAARLGARTRGARFRSACISGAPALRSHFGFYFRSFATRKFRRLLRGPRSRPVAVYVVLGVVAARDCASAEPVSHSRDLRARGLESRLANVGSACKLVGFADHTRFWPCHRL